MKLTDVISEFIEAQRYVRRRLQKEYSLPDSMSAVEWSLSWQKIREMHKEKPIAKIFRPHGYGLEFQDDNVHIDFDLCRSGRVDGFDAWRLYVFCRDNGLETECKEYLEFKAALEELEKNGVVEKEENLFFLK